MLWAVRGTERQTNKDITLVVEAESRAEAECMAIRRGIPVVIIEEATGGDIAFARESRLLFCHTRSSRHSCLGQPVNKLQLALLMLCGIATAVLILRSTNVAIASLLDRFI